MIVSNLFHYCFTQLSYHSNTNILLCSEVGGELKNENLENINNNRNNARRSSIANIHSICNALGLWLIRRLGRHDGRKRRRNDGRGYGYGYNNPGAAAPNNQYYQPVYPFQFGGGCHGRFGGYGATAPYTSNGAPLNITTAKTIAENYVASTNNPDLAVKEVEEYQANFYVQVTEKSTGNGAFELLINKYTGSIYPEMGPNMMWNTKYGMMRGGILGRTLWHTHHKHDSHSNPSNS